MTNVDRDDLPPDLADLGRRMRDERPVADDAALDRMLKRAHTAPRRTARRAPRRALTVSLATMFAMVCTTGVAAAALFGVSFSQLGNALTSSSQKVGTASSQALQAPSSSRAPAASTPSLPAPIGSAAGAVGSNAGAAPDAAAPGMAASPSADQIPGNLPNAGLFQYGPGRVVCRVLNALGLRRIARLLGC